MLDLQKYIGFPKIIVDTVDAKTTTYDLQYLPRWMGHTLGNAFRRIMLAYDMAASVTGMTIRWVTHEYQVVDGMKESVVEIMLHIKKLRFLMDDLDEKEIVLSAKTELGLTMALAGGVLYVVGTISSKPQLAEAGKWIAGLGP